MRSKTYRASTMKEAMTRVRRDLGGDAVILSAREVRRRRLFGLGPRSAVEVTASDTMPADAAASREVRGAAQSHFVDQWTGGASFFRLDGAIRRRAREAPCHGREPEPAGTYRALASGHAGCTRTDLLATDRGRRTRGALPPSRAVHLRPARAGRSGAARVDSRRCARRWSSAFRSLGRSGLCRARGGSWPWSARRGWARRRRWPSWPRP